MRFLARASLLAIATASSQAFAQGTGWETFGPPLFQVSAVATPADNAAVYAASSDFAAGQSAIFRSPDGGLTWAPLVEAAAGEFYSDILVDPFNPATLYAGAPGNSNTTPIYRSANSGSTWQLGVTIPAYCVPSFAAGAIAGTAFVSCGTNFYRTTDAGATWQPVANPFTEATRLAAGPAGLLLAYGPTKIFRSANSGDTWSPAGNAPGTCAGLNALRVSPANANALVAGTGISGVSGFQCGGVFRSADGGATWTAGSLTGVFVTDVEIDPNDTTRVYASAGFLPGVLPKGGVFNSLDGGSGWTDMDLPLNGAAKVALSARGDRLYAATSLGVYAIAVTTGPPVCTPDATTLCLGTGRFRVRATWTRPDGSSGPGHAIALTGDTGDFWFFANTNVELIVKVLDGCVANGHRWVFASGLTNVLTTITVTDMLTGAVKTYTNPQGVAFRPIQDTSAFTCD